MKIFCIGRNYVNHAKELKNPVPKKPLVFSKFPTSLLKDNQPFYYPDFSEDIHHELELVLKICKNGKKVQPQFAKDYYNEIGLGIDFTCRDIQSQLKAKGHSWEIAKAFDGSAPVSAFISLDSLADKQNISFSLKKNGQEVQAGESKDMIFDFDHLICYISQYFTLQKGDLIFTGTPEGVGPVAIGDKLEGFIEGEKLLDFEIK